MGKTTVARRGLISPHTKALEVKLPDEKPEGEVPDIYCDGTQMGLTPYDVMIFLLRRPADPSKQNEPVRVGTLRMSLEHAKVFAIILRKNLQNALYIRVLKVKVNPAIFDFDVLRFRAPGLPQCHRADPNH